MKTAICDGGGGGRFCEGKGNTSFVQSFLPFKDYIELLKKNEYILKASDLKEPREEKDGGMLEILLWALHWPKLTLPPWPRKSVSSEDETYLVSVYWQTDQRVGF